MRGQLLRNPIRQCSGMLRLRSLSIALFGFTRSTKSLKRLILRAGSIAAPEIGCIPLLCENVIGRSLPAFRYQRRRKTPRGKSRMLPSHLPYIPESSRAKTEPIVPQSRQASRNRDLPAMSLAVFPTVLLQADITTGSSGFGRALLAAGTLATEPLSFVWRILAALAVGALLLVVILAIIEPGPLVKRRPFPRKQRSAKRSAQETASADRDLPGPLPAEGDFAKYEGERTDRQASRDSPDPDRQ